MTGGKINILRTIYRSAVCAAGAFTLCFSIFFELGELCVSGRAEELILRKFFLSVPVPEEETPAGAELFPYALLTPEREGDLIFSIEEPEAEKELITEGHILAADLSGDPMGRVLLKNETSYDIEPASFPGKFPPGRGSPKVLIIHTHTTECYMKGGEEYEKDTATRSGDPELGVLAVGRKVCEILNDNGISAIQCTTLHDEVSYIHAYDNSLASVKEYLAKYPDIEYVFDIHRDAIVRSDGTAVKPLTEYRGMPAAQIMILCGTDEQGGAFDRWRENFAFGCAVQRAMLGLCGSAARPLLIRGATYHQQYAPHFLLVEVGAFANTVDEALAGAELFADALCTVLSPE